MDGIDRRSGGAAVRPVVVIELLPALTGGFLSLGGASPPEREVDLLRRLTQACGHDERHRRGIRAAMLLGGDTRPRR